ncbi:MAG: hypothetical protein IJ757_00910 [Clostridiales bacterium]|nr:hypothetical protein [Clostridiales bacterium]
MDDKVLELVYQEKLEEKLLCYMAEKYNIDYMTAMSLYYKSELAQKIHEGKYGIQYLDYKVLVQILEDTEPELFSDIG